MTTEKFWTRLIRLWKCLLIVFGRKEDTSNNKNYVTFFKTPWLCFQYKYYANYLTSNTFNRFRHLKVSIADSI